jgi:hypothetical protein
MMIDIDYRSPNSSFASTSSPSIQGCRTISIRMEGGCLTSIQAITCESVEVSPGAGGFAIRKPSNPSVTGTLTASYRMRLSLRFLPKNRDCGFYAGMLQNLLRMKPGMVFASIMTRTTIRHLLTMPALRPHFAARNQTPTGLACYFQTFTMAPITTTWATVA